VTTAEALEGITDESAFELLAVRALRELEPDCHSLVHLGMNSQGKTIRSPLDGFCSVPNYTSPLYVMVAATTTSLKSLKSKWLSNGLPSKPKPARSTKAKPAHLTKKSATSKAPALELGDVPKAILEALHVRATVPTAKFTLYLATNRAITKELILEAEAAGKAGGVEVRFIEQSRLRDFLDVTPVGHWLRWKHLGIDSDLISLPLLHELSETNISQYASDITLFEHQFLVETESEKRIGEQLLNPSFRLHLLIGDSGVGKSTTGLTLLRRHHASGKPGLWISAELLDRASSLNSALEMALKSQLPSLRSGAGQDVLNQIPEEEPLLLVFDDINRSPSPINLLRKIIGWLRPLTEKKDGRDLLRNVRVICPLWQAHWASLQNSLESSGWIRSVTVTAFTKVESLKSLQSGLPERSEHDLRRFATALHDDPILIGLFNSYFSTRQQDASLAACSDVIGTFMRERLSEIASALNEPAILMESTLKKLAIRLVVNRELRPAWGLVETWFGDDISGLFRLKQLAAQAHLARIVDRGDSMVWEFRHDRLMGHYVVTAIMELLQGSDPKRQAVFDPYFVPYLGQAIAALSPTNALLDEVVKKRPASLVASLRYMRVTPSVDRPAIVDAVGRFLIDDKQMAAEWHDSVRLLEEVATRFTIALTTPRKLERPFWHARFRNGDVLSGALIMCREFFPRTHFVWLETLVADAISTSRTQFVASLRSLLTSENISPDMKEGGLLLAGYLGEPSLVGEIVALWKDSTVTGKARRDLLLCALWAALRSANKDLDSSIGILIREVNSLDDSTSENHHISERGSLLQELSHAGRHGYPSSVLRYLANFATDEDHRWTVMQILDHVDHPIAVAYMVRTLGALEHRAHESGGFNPYTSFWRENWDGTRGRSSLSQESLDTVRKLWEDRTEPSWVRSYAFSLWSRLIPDLTALQTAQPEDPYFLTAVWHRVELGDLTATEAYLKILEGRPFWIGELAHIWTPALRPLLEARIQQLESGNVSIDSNEDYQLSGVLRDMPASDAEEILAQHWDCLRKRHHFVHVALYVATDRTRALAAEALQGWTGDKDPFEHVDHTFGFFTYGLSDRLTLKHLQSLLPYVDKLSARVLEHMVEFCGRHGHREFAMKYLISRARQLLSDGSLLDENHIRILSHSLTEWFPTEEDHLRVFDDAAKDDWRTDYALEHWIEGFGRREEKVPDLPAILSLWWDRGTQGRVRVASTLIRYWGTRKNLAFLEDKLSTHANGNAVNLADIVYEVQRRTPI